MVRKLAVVLAMAGCVLGLGTARAESEISNGKKVTAWLGGPAVLHFHPSQEGKFSVGLGVGPVMLDSTDYSTGSNEIKTGFIVEGMFYPQGNNAGLATNLRIGTGAGTYLAPGVFYVSRPSGNVVGRIGLMFPVGGDGVVPFLPEVAIGLRI
ncbi:MAG: hypothetical protein NT029_12965 [Armatimonadetes bacterium]|nr:hypothetical protein [Armatimonadota bacterium]